MAVLFARPFPDDPKKGDKSGLYVNSGTDDSQAAIDGEKNRDIRV